MPFQALFEWAIISGTGYGLPKRKNRGKMGLMVDPLFRGKKLYPQDGISGRIDK
jgi:hypothetical protein